MLVVFFFSMCLFNQPSPLTENILFPLFPPPCRATFVTLNVSVYAWVYWGFILSHWFISLLVLGTLLLSVMIFVVFFGRCP